jgi:4-amino-4-deoxy-L-arabinose transferase-like glycosyltransferase
MLALAAKAPTLTRPNPPWRVGIIILLALLVTAPALVWHEIPERDSANYALMTDEFARGNYARAYHPNVPPLLITLGGSLAHLVTDPFRANRIVSILLFLLGIPGTFRLVKELKDERIASIAAILYTFCPQTVYLATSGGVDAGKLGLLPWLTWAGLRWSHHGGATWGITVGVLGALIGLARGEGIFFAIAVLCWYLFDAARQERYRFGALGGRLTGLIGAVLSLILVLLPWLFYQRSQTGLWVTHPTQLRIYTWFGVQNQWPIETIVDVNSIEPPSEPEPVNQPVVLTVKPDKPSSPKDQSNPSVSQPTTPTVPPSESVDLRDNRKNISWIRNLEKVTKGACIPYLILAIGGAIWAKRKGMIPWRHGGALPLILIALNLAIFYPTNIMAARYVSATIPLFLHLSAIGVLACEADLQRRPFFTRQRLRLAAGIGVVTLALLSQGRLDMFIPPHKRSEQLALMQLGAWIRQHAHEFPTYGTLPNQSFYHNGKVPILLETDGRLRYYARTDGLVLYSFYRYTPSQITAICRQGKVGVIAYDERMEALCPGFGQYWRREPAYVPVDLGPELSDLPAGAPMLLCFRADRSTLP